MSVYVSVIVFSFSIHYIAVMDKFKKKIEEQATIKKEESNKEFYGNRFTGKIDSSPNGEQSKTKYHTDKELAKLAGVGTGTIARFNRVMNSDKKRCYDEH